MHHAVSKRCGADLSAFRLVDVEVDIVTGEISVALEIVLQREQTVCDLMIEPGNGHMGALALGRFRVGVQQVCLGRDFCEGFTADGEGFPR